MINKKFLIAMAVVSFLFASSANAAILPSSDIIAPDSPFYFLQTWKESIQTFFTFGLENKAKQYLHLAEVRLDEYKNMIEQGKTDIAEKVLEKYQKQLNHALDKVKEIQDKGKDVKDLSQKIEEAVSKHLEVLQENLQKVPEQAKKGLENAIENSQKQIEKIRGETKFCTQEAKQCSDGSYVSRTGPNCEFAACPEAKTDEIAPKMERDFQRISDIKQLQLAAELYFDTNGFYPKNLSELVPKFISKIPTDPQNRTPYSYAFHSSETKKFDSYHLGASLETQEQVLKSDKDCNSINGNGCPYKTGYDKVSAFNGSDSNGCRKEIGKYCYDLTP